MCVTRINALLGRGPSQLTSGTHLPFKPDPATLRSLHPRHAPGRGSPGPVAVTVPAAPPWRGGASSPAWPAAAPRSGTGAPGSAGAIGGPELSRTTGPDLQSRGADCGGGTGRAAARSLGRRSRDDHARRPAARRRSGARRTTAPLRPARGCCGRHPATPMRARCYAPGASGMPSGRSPGAVPQDSGQQVRLPRQDGAWALGRPLGLTGLL